MSTRSAVALGSNLGDRLATLREAVSRLGDLGMVIAVSSLYETAPVGGPPQDPYLNAVVVIDSDLYPAGLLAALHEIEAEAGRVRQERWGPRTLDLDIITVLDSSGSPVVVDSPELTIPHPRAVERAFVLEPLTEVWPQAPLGTVSAVRAAAASHDDQGVEILGPDWVGTSRGRVPVLLMAIQILALAAFAALVLATGRWPVTAWRLGLGAALTVGGALLATWGAARLGPALTPSPEPRPQTELVTSGPYRWLRHPIYAGVVLALVGVAIGAASVPALALAIAIGIFLWFKARFEESRLRLLVAGYPAYMRRVRGRLAPWPRRTEG